MSPPPTSKSNSSQTQALKIYTWGISLLGILLIFLAITKIYPYTWETLIFVGLVITAELLTKSNLFAAEMLFSISSAVTFAALLLFGPYVGAVAASSGGMVVTVALFFEKKNHQRQSTLVQRILFNMAALGIPAAIAGWVYLSLGGTLGEIDIVSNLLPIVIAAFSLEFANAALVIGAVAIQTGASPMTIWRRNASWLVPINILTMAIGGGGMAYAFQIAGYVGVAVFFIPIAMTVYSVRLYVQQTKKQMEQLEQTVEERTADLQKAYDDLKQLDQTKTAFFAIVNHEMRSPLTAIIGYTGLLRRDASLTDDQRRQVDAIYANSNRVIDLVKNILDVSRIEDGKLEIMPEHASIIPIVHDAIATVEPLAHGKLISIAFEVTIPPDTTVYADAKRVAQIVINLVNNAVKYTPETGTVQVKICFANDENMVQVDVIDTGIGIPETVLPVIFDRFSRAERDDIRGISGTGLGLTIAKGLVDAHHGNIWAKSIEGEGATFSFTLPITLPDPPVIPATDSTTDIE